jgi:hypothetical protein
MNSWIMKLWSANTLTRRMGELVRSLKWWTWALLFTEWIQSLVHQLFISYEGDLIMRIPLYLRPAADRLIWRFDKRGFTMSRVDTLLLGQLRISLIMYLLQVVTSFLNFGAPFSGLMSLLRSGLLFGDYC